MSFLDALRHGFSRTFWVANVLELFERFAYYGSKAILAVYIAEQVGLGPETAGLLVGVGLQHAPLLPARPRRDRSSTATASSAA